MSLRFVTSLGCVALASLTLATAQARTSHPSAPRGPAIETSIPTLEQLEAQGARVGEIRVVVEEIFDPQDPREDGWLYRTANRLHIETKQSTVRSQLLFSPGDKLSARVMHETERILRERRYIYDAWIRPISWDGQTATIEVRIRDVWTLNPGISFGRKGGKNTSGFELQDENVLGRGKNLQVSHKSGVDRTSDSFLYEDPNVFGSRWRFVGRLSDNSDGEEQQFDVSRPFYSLDARWAFGLSGLDSDRIDSRYDRGFIVDQYRHAEQRASVAFGFSPGREGRWTQRWIAGARYERSLFTRIATTLQPAALPGDRELAYPYVAFELIEDAYDETYDQDQLARTEDVYYGLSLRSELGYAGETFGSDRDAVMFATSLRTGHRLAPEHSLFATASVDGRLEYGRGRDVIGRVNARYFWRWDPQRVFYVSLDAAAVHELDPDSQLVLGGEEGLRGYPLRFQNGTARALLTVEQRFYTNWFPFRLFNVGGALFFDAGRTWGRGVVGAEPEGLLKDVGFGLRFGNSRSGLGNVIHVDFSYALDAPANVDDFQITVETKRSF